MLEKKTFPIERIYVPAKRAKTLDADKVTALANDILENGQKTPIRLRADGERFVLIEGLHRLEALRALGEDTVEGYLVRARLH
jgi:ParB-like chromosome segregation protein Spo0J